MIYKMLLIYITHESTAPLYFHSCRKRHKVNLLSLHVEAFSFFSEQFNYIFATCPVTMSTRTRDNQTSIFIWKTEKSFYGQ